MFPKSCWRILLWTENHQGTLELSTIAIGMLQLAAPKRKLVSGGYAPVLAPTCTQFRFPVWSHFWRILVGKYHLCEVNPVLLMNDTLCLQVSENEQWDLSPISISFCSSCVESVALKSSLLPFMLPTSLMHAIGLYSSCDKYFQVKDVVGAVTVMDHLERDSLTPLIVEASLLTLLFAMICLYSLCFCNYHCSYFDAIATLTFCK